MHQNVYSIQVLCGKGKTQNVYRIQTIWNNNNFNITILDGSKAFKSNVSEEKLMELATKYEIEFEKYIDSVRASLCGKHLQDFTYNRKDNTFFISRQEDNFSLRFANFDLESIDFPTATISFIDEIMRCNDEFQKQLLTYRTETENAIKERNVYSDKLEHFVTEKRKMENELYCKFILLLNEKKIRIQYLTEMLQRYKNVKENQYDGDMSDLENNVQQKINALKNETISDSGSDSCDEDINVSKITHEVQIESTPKKKLNFFDDDENEQCIDSLPKRTKVSNNVENNNNNETNLREDTKKSPEQKSNFDFISKVAETQNTLDFNTQDLFDRL